MLALFRSQPRAFYMIFMLEIWERFGYYTVQGLLTFYFMRFLGFDDQTAFYTFGAFSALVYGMVALGGYLGDNVLGTKRTIILGLFVLFAGYFALAFANQYNVFYALGLICVGNGLFKANPSNLLAKCYEINDPRLHGGFTLYYMAVNLGSIAALFLGPALAMNYGYSHAYFMSAIGLLLGLLNYYFQRRHIACVNTLYDNQPVALWKWLIIFAGILGATAISAYLLQHVLLAKNLLLAVIAAVLLVYGLYMRQENKAVIQRMVLALILMLEAVIFFVLYQQMPTSINLFAINNVHPSLFGVTLDPQSFQVLNPLWIVVMSPLLAQCYAKLHQKNIAFPTPYKFALGMSLCGFGFLVLYLARFGADEMGMVSSGWLVASYCFQSLGELLVSALGVAMVAELVPAQITGFVMGMFFLTPAIAGFIGAYIASFTALPENLKPGVESLMIYTDVFASIGVVILLISFVMWLTAPYLSRLMGGRTGAVSSEKEPIPAKKYEKVMVS